jgi:putative hydrolase of the HAD superfamily
MIKAVIFDMYETLITHYETPLYFGSQMARDAGIPERVFLTEWRATEQQRTIGGMSLEQVLEQILRGQGRYTPELLGKMVMKRKATKEDCFLHLHKEILPMLGLLKEKGLQIGLISNCFSEEAEVIRGSVLFPYFDAVCLSWEMGLQKPNPEIFRRCLQKLGQAAEACLYVGDGGSAELETARGLGMEAAQALWYRKELGGPAIVRKDAFPALGTPMEVLSFLSDEEG